MIDARNHWEAVYQARQPEEVSWYRPHLEVSIQMVEDAAVHPGAHIIDVGAGESTLVDDLLHRGYRNLYALDLSRTALDVARARLKTESERVHWICGDVLSQAFSRHQFDVWHDRAVFHFLTDPDDRAAYVRQVADAVRPGGHVIVATFGPEGPARCSGLDVVRYGPMALHAQFGTGFRVIGHRTELHRTPQGATQQFSYCHCTTRPAES